MPLVPTTLQATLLAGFIPTMTDDIFASTLATGINTFVTTGLINAPAIVGGVSAGAFTGTVAAGTMATSIKAGDITPISDAMKKAWNDVADWYGGDTDKDDELKQKIEQAKTEKGGDYLASELAKVVDSACRDAQFICVIVGTAVQGPSSTPLTGNGKVTWTGQASVLETALKSVFQLNTDVAIAQGIATAVMTYLTTAQIKIDGQGPLMGATGMGLMS